MSLLHSARKVVLVSHCDRVLSSMISLTLFVVSRPAARWWMCWCCIFLKKIGTIVFLLGERQVSAR